MIYTKKWLEERGLSGDVVDWWLRNKLDQEYINLDKIKGDYRSYIDWLRDARRVIVEYDDNNNMTKRTHPDGGVYLYEYDSNNNMTKKVYPSGNTYLYEYDDNGNMVRIVYPDGDTYLYKYVKTHTTFKMYEYDECILAIPFTKE